jgi:hypothetical protein
MTSPTWHGDRPLHGVPVLFARRATGWDHHRLSVMMLPMVPAVMLAFVVLVMESEAPGAKVPVQSASYCCAVTTEGDEAGASDESIREGRATRSSGFRVVYTRRESRAIEVSRFLQALNPQMRELDQRRLSALLVRLGEHYGYDPALIVAVIMTESSFDPRSRSHKGALGLMQILPTTGQSLAIETQRPWSGERTLFDPYLNLSLGVRYLAKLQKRFGTLDVALVAYNYGPSRVDEMLRRGESLPTEYTRRVLTRYREFLALQDASSL